MDDGLQAEKSALRAALLERRALVDAATRARWSGELAGVVLGTPQWGSARSVAAFVGVRGEPITDALLRAALSAGKRLWLPRVDSPVDLVFAEVTSLERLVPARFGLTEPSPHARAVALGETGVELVIVPGLAFGSDGSRLGYGRGYYDRALEGLPEPRPTCIGVCFSGFVDPAEGPIPMGPHDRRVDAVATEGGLVVRGGGRLSR